MQHGSTHRGPAIQPSASGIPESSGQQDPSFAQSVPSTSEADSTTGKQRGRAGFKCAECGVVKYRKPDFEGHLWSKHGLGDPIVCNRGTCGGKSYSSASSLRQHIRAIYQGQYKFNCDRCDYGNDNYDCLTSHKARKHRVRQKTPKGKVILYACKKCKKEFDAPHLLRKHETNETCTRKKTIPCPDCTRFYKTKEGLEYHQEQQHKGKNPHAPFVARWFQKRPCLTTRSSTPLKELSKGPKTLLPRPKGERELLLSLHYSWPRGRLLQGRRVVLQSLPLQKSGSLQKGEEHKQHTAGK